MADDPELGGLANIVETQRQLNALREEWRDAMVRQLYPFGRPQYRPLSARTRWRARLRWRVRGARERLALKLAPWLGDW